MSFAREFATLQFKRLHPDAQLPTRASEHAAGYDLYAIAPLNLHPGQRAPIATGVAVAIPHGFCGRIAPRSGFAISPDIEVLAGVIDCDYRGEIRVVLVNLSTYYRFSTRYGLGSYDTFSIRRGQRIAQLIVESIITLPPEWVDELPKTPRGRGGFGSTGK